MVFFVYGRGSDIAFVLAIGLLTVCESLKQHSGAIFDMVVALQVNLF
jgi:hypothetical protein